MSKDDFEISSWKFTYDWAMYLFENVGDVSINTIKSWKEKAEKWDKLVSFSHTSESVDSLVEWLIENALEK